MAQRIIYETDEGGVAVIIPTQSALDEHGIDAIAAKDVPSGKAYKIINADDVPSDRTFRDAWEADLTNPDGIGGEHDMFITDPQHPDYVNPEANNDNSQPE
jgi:hypothetical protein